MKSQVLKFSDLEFKPHGCIADAVQATVDFNNGEWISVVGGGYGLYGNGETSFEVMSSVTRGNVKSWQSKDKVTRHMRYLQSKQNNTLHLCSKK